MLLFHFPQIYQTECYLLKLYQILHPEDITATEDSLTDITIENVLTDNLYNDSGFIVNNKLMILVEAQSTWTDKTAWIDTKGNIRNNSHM